MAEESGAPTAIDEHHLRELLTAEVSSLRESLATCSAARQELLSDLNSLAVRLADQTALVSLLRTQLQDKDAELTRRQAEARATAESEPAQPDRSAQGGGLRGKAARVLRRQRPETGTP